MLSALSPAVVLLVVAALLSLALLVVTLSYRQERGAVPLMGIQLSAMVWCLAYAGRLTSESDAAKLFWNDVRFLGPTLVSVSALFLALEYTNRERWVTPWTVAAVSVLPVVTNVLVWTNQYHGVVREGLRAVPGTLDVVIVYNWWYYVHATYSYTLLVVATVLIGRKFFESQHIRRFRRQTSLILLALVAPWAGNVVYITGLTAVDPTPFALVLTAVLVALGLFRYGIFEALPVARSTATDNMEAGLIIVDAEDRVIDVNTRGEEIIDRELDAVLGRHLAEVFADYPDLIRQFIDEYEVHDRFELDEEDGTRHFEVDISPVYDSADRYTGRVIILREITERIQRELELQRRTEELERQNERLDQFASIVSHDLRNPLNVIHGRMTLARETGEEEHFDRMDRAIQRMEHIIDDMLTLARQGQTVEEREWLDLEDLAREAWANVDTADATLSIDTDREVSADRSRLLQLFENLFRNSVEHGGDSVTITVGDLMDGFYVADDGPGIPAEEREQVLEQGFTTAEDGTGFGLAIVRNAVEAHGWALAVKESESGGARFDVTGLGEDAPVGPNLRREVRQATE